MDKRLHNIYNDLLTNRYCRPHTDTPSRGMCYWLERGRYEIVGNVHNNNIKVHLHKATLMQVYTSRKTHDTNIYQSKRGCNTQPFVIIPSYTSSAYCWRIPVTIHDCK